MSHWQDCRWGTASFTAVINDSLSDQDIGQLRAELAGGGTPTVWFTAAAVGMAAGKSAKVVSFTEPAEGDYIQVRPTGSQDEVSFSPAELTLTRPPRKQAVRKAPATSGPPAQEPPAQEPPAQKPSGQEPTGQKPPGPPLVEQANPRTAAPAEPTKASKGRPKASGGRTKPPAEVSVTLNSTQEGEWTVEVTVGKKRAVRPTPVAAACVAKAARSLPPEVEDAIDSVLDAARRLQEERVARLQAELDAARRTLAELSE